VRQGMLTAAMKPRLAVSKAPCGFTGSLDSNRRPYAKPFIEAIDRRSREPARQSN